MQLHTTNTRASAARGILLVLLFCASGCGQPEVHPSRSPEHLANVAEAESTIVDLMDPTKPIPAQRFLQARETVVVPGDALEIRAYDNKDLSGLFLVPPDGNVNLPFIGSVDVVDKTPSQLDEEITLAMNDYFRNVDIMVNIKDPAQRSVYVVGQVRNPGRFEFEYGDRVFHALGRAGGMQDRAREAGIVLVRREADGRDHAYHLDFSKVHHFVAPGDIHLQPGDVIFVPKDRFSTFTEFATQLLDVVNKALTSGVLVDQLLDIRVRTLSITTGQ